MTQAEQAFAYLRPSALHDAPGGGRLALETSGGATPGGARAHPSFFSGFLTSPRTAAAGLLAVADVAAARYRNPRAPALLDPVVTGNGDRLRFESFSGCGGVHARLDVLRAGLDGADVGHGTTNVDVNGPLREALARTGAADPLHLRVGPDELAVTTLDGPVLEKKVPLPDRWLRGFAETQVIASGFDLRAELSAAEAVRFLRGLPRAAGPAPPRWFVPARGGLRATSKAVPGAVCLPGPHRLAALQRVLRYATALRVYGPPTGPSAPGPVASAWELALPGMRLTLMLSPETDRGFSGEGAVLDALTADGTAEDADLLSVLLAWEPRVDIASLAEQSGLDTARVSAALTRLGTAGRIGYDTAEAAYFHRELPYSAHGVERHNPRLRAARALLAEGAVTPQPGGTALVRGSKGDLHLVRTAGDRLSCTCRWWATYRGGRGPCSHALAVRLHARGAQPLATPSGQKERTP
ncbi:SWIM zinc finger family protein [Streptomyces avicenniae]|uniref:SWIM zinc finger family protein n=1 Tax=Streptomyces avicenniae TaxID=500153 RepID=UPI00069A728F|nr:SWIM zinc finger family protein [Streptomyces avicenniae]